MLLGCKTTIKQTHKKCFDVCVTHQRTPCAFQLVPLQAVLDFRETATIPYLKQLSMSVYTHCRRHVAFTPLGRSLTGFGPTAGADKILRAKEHVVSIDERLGLQGSFVGDLFLCLAQFLNIVSSSP